MVIHLPVQCRAWDYARAPEAAVGVCVLRPVPVVAHGVEGIEVGARVAVPHVCDIAGLHAVLGLHLRYPRRCGHDEPEHDERD